MKLLLSDPFLSYLSIILLHLLVDIMEDPNKVFHLRKIVIIRKRGDINCTYSKIFMFESRVHTVRLV